MARRRMRTFAFGGWLDSLFGGRSSRRVGVNQMRRKARRRRRVYR